MQKPHSETHTDVTGVLLAGGGSTRMGRDKASLLMEGQPLFVRGRRACSPAKQAVIRQHELEPTVEESIAREFNGVDLVITEGFKHSSLPKIEVHRAAFGMLLLSRGDRHDPSLQAVASDESLELDLPCFDLNNPSRLADFLEESFLA